MVPAAAPRKAVKASRGENSSAATATRAEAARPSEVRPQTPTREVWKKCEISTEVHVSRWSNNIDI